MIETKDLYYLNMVSNEFRSSVYEVLYVGVTAYNRFFNENTDIVKSYFFSNIKTRLLTFMIYRQFESDMLGRGVPFVADISKVNNFGYNALNLRDDRVKVSLAKTTKASELPNKSVYRRKDAINNFKYETQLKFNFDKHEYPIENAPAYFIIGFGVKNEKLTHLNLLMPDVTMNSSISNIDLLKEYYEWTTDSKDEVHIEEQIVKVKSEALKIIVNEG